MFMKKQTSRAVIQLSNFGYLIACAILYIFAIAILFTSVWSILSDIFSKNYTVYNLLDEVGLIVFSIAVIDVGKYLMLEEVLRKEALEEPSIQSRKTLTKFAIIIASALSLEGLVLTIEVAKQDVTKIFYPVAVLITATLYIVGLGVYQKLSTSAEK